VPELTDHTQRPLLNMVSHPPHYQRPGGLECIDAIEAMVADWPGSTGLRLGTVVKYLWRHKQKGRPLEDLKKARWYLDREIASYEGTER
jgi:hypothetical protein